MPSYEIMLRVTQEEVDSPEEAVRELAHDLCERGWAWQLSYEVREVQDRRPLGVVGKVEDTATAPVIVYAEKLERL